MKINALNVFPLSFHPQEDAIRRTLIERGEKVSRLQGRE